ncbi:TetR/AcrR family transcriptional regulator [Aeromicrobium sp. CnD17-E]|uniref:TetR/AcrR family transcriptional regulator n=1 Tax=Aeromicrobium sp. CnD17-E TaxID=2954487 RepID=UPI002098351F|nr:TetR/AcrR family transcriptional regulator [Aeromicrobium sp. CnD17-E]MCO7240005.1 TetR/AcrR family transcriptional regulator [Aeromicrobium sp. CnD17-E]
MTATARERLLEAAVEAFAEKGFTATTTRDIAARAGMSPAAVYVHHDTKESLLFTVSIDGHRSALQVVESADDPAAAPPERLRRFVHDFSAWHASHSRVGRIVQYEFDALTPEHRSEVAALRRAIERVMQRVLEAGVASGDFAVDDVVGTTRAILSLSIDLVRWFSPTGPQTPEDVAELHARLALRMVLAHDD